MSSTQLGLDAHPRDVYASCPDYQHLCVLLQTNPVPAVTRLAQRIRNWKLNHKLPTLQDAFVEHRRYTLEPDKYRTQHRKRPRTSESPTSPAALLDQPAPEESQTEDASSSAVVVETARAEVPLDRFRALEERVYQLEKLVAEMHEQLNPPAYQPT